MKFNFSFKNLLIKFLITCFIISLIFAFLFSPKVIDKIGFSHQKSLAVFTFAKFIDSKCIKMFEKENCVKVNVNYYENNDELLVKLRKTGGSGFDIIIPSDYAVELLIRDGLLKKLDKEKLNFIDKLDPNLMGKYFDPENNYSMPYAWETYKIGYNKKMFNGNVPMESWKVVFDEKYSPKAIVMNNTPREAILLAAFYLYGSIDNIDDKKLKEIKDLLIRQKKWVEVYSDRRSDYYLASEACSIAVGSSGEIWRAARADKNIGYVIPQEGTFMILDSVVISAKSANEDLAYKFMNFLYRDDIIKRHALKYSIFHAVKNIDFDDFFVKSLGHIREKAKNAEFFRNVLKEDQMNKVWIDLKVN